MALQGRKIYCLQVRACIFQPVNFACWGSEGVNTHDRRSRGSADTPAAPRGCSTTAQSVSHRGFGSCCDPASHRGSPRPSGTVTLRSSSARISSPRWCARSRPGSSLPSRPLGRQRLLNKEKNKNKTEKLQTSSIAAEARSCSVQDGIYALGKVQTSSSV